MSQARLPLALLILTAVAGPDPVMASPDPVTTRPSGWGTGWGPMEPAPVQTRSSSRDSREGRVDVARFVAPDIDASTLGQGRIGIGEMPGDGIASLQNVSYEAAVVDQLAKAGYDTMTPDAEGGQVAEVRITRDTVAPAELPRKPVSGETTVGVSNHGSQFGMAVAVDLTKPAKALISTGLMVRIVDRASGKGLWEGRANIITREGDTRWNEQEIAARLATELFKGFPSAS